MYDRSADLALARLAEGQRGVFTRSDAAELGLDRHALTRREALGRIRRLHESVYAFVGVPPDFGQAVLSATLAIAESSASFESAGWALEFTAMGPLEVAVTVALGMTTRLSGVTVHRTRYLPDRHIVMVDGIRCTSRVRTIFDLASRYGDTRLGRVLDDQLARRLVSFAELVDEFDAWTAKGRPGSARVRRLLERRASGSVVPESELERRFLDLIAAAGIMHPTLQFRPPWGVGLIGRVDAAFVEQRVLVELDGRRWHSRDESFEADRRRDQLAVAAGWRALRFTWRQITDTPHEVITVLRAVLA